MKVREVNIPIYTGKLIIVVTKNFNKAVKKLNITDLENVNEYEAFVVKRYSKKGWAKFMVFFKPGFSANTLSHEIVHLVNNIFEHHHIKLDSDNDEPQAYLTGWLTEEICKVIKKK